MRSGDTSVDVCIVGYGPTGATLANLLGQARVSTLVVERQAAPYDLPRAVGFDAEVMRIFQTVGLADRILPITTISVGTRFIDGFGRLLLEWPRAQDIGPMGWHAGYRDRAGCGYAGLFQICRKIATSDLYPYPTPIVEKETWNQISFDCASGFVN